MIKTIHDYVDTMPPDVRAAYERLKEKGFETTWSMRKVHPDENLVKHWVLSQAGTYIKYELGD